MQGEDYRDDGDWEEEEEEYDEVDDDGYHADIEDSNIITAAPDDAGEDREPADLQDPLAESDSHGSSELISRPFRLPPSASIPCFWYRMFDRVTSAIFAELDIDPTLGATILWGRSVTESEKLAWLEAFENEGKDRAYLTLVQLRILEVFANGIQHGWKSFEKLMDETRANMSDLAPPNSEATLNDWTRHSNGYCAILHNEILYGGSWSDGSGLADGFSIQSARSALRSYSD